MAIPTHLKQTAPDRLEIRLGGGWYILFGLPFLGGSVPMFLLLFGMLPGNTGNTPVPGSGPWIVMLVAALAFFSVGIGSITGRSWVIIERSRGSVMTAWGLLVPMKFRERSISEFHAVHLYFNLGGTTTNGRRAQDEYRASLQTASGSSPITLGSSPKYAKTRKLAATVAEFTGLPLVDNSTQHQSVIAPEDARKSYPQRLRKGTIPVARYVPPQNMRSRVMQEAGAVQIVTPGPGLSPGIWGNLIVPVMALVFLSGPVLYLAKSNSLTNFHKIPPAFLCFFGFIFLLAVVGPLLNFVILLIQAKRAHTTVRVNAKELVIAENTGLRTKTTRIPADDIMDLDYSQAGETRDALQPYAAFRWVGNLLSSRGVIVKATCGLFTFGAGLPDEEVAYLHYLTQEALRG